MKNRIEYYCKQINQKMLVIGISSKVPMTFESSNNRALNNSVHLATDSIINWLSHHPIIPIIIPLIVDNDKISYYSKILDGLILQGGSDIHPRFYNNEQSHHVQTELLERDNFEIELIKSFSLKNKPILGICRGAQLLNVVDGGTLYQDICCQHPSQSNIHNSKEKNEHNVLWKEDSVFFGKTSIQKVVSIHHQCIKTLGENTKIEAISPNDNVIEAIRNTKYHFVYGIQWHPELHNEKHMDSSIILTEFIKFCKKRKYTL